MSNKYFREFPKNWGDDLYPNLQNRNQIAHFCYLCEEIYSNLTMIEKYDKEKFNSISSFSIESFIEVFDIMYKKFYNLICKDSYDNAKMSELALNSDFKDPYLYWNKDKRFDISLKDLNEDKFNIEEKCVSQNNLTLIATLVTGIKDEYYEQIKSAVNKILIFERDLKYITMKDEFWKDVAKSTEDINLNNDFCICGKLLFEGGWRISCNDKEVKDFGKDKIYQSASIISKDTLNKLFIPNETMSSFKAKAFLVYKFDLSKVACVSYRDAYSDELIDGDTKFQEMTMHTNIQKIDESIIKDKKHELFAYSPVFSTLNCVLKPYSLYNEVVLTDPEPIGVIAMNRYSEDYALLLAKQYNVDYLGVMPKKQSANFELDFNNV